MLKKRNIYELSLLDSSVNILLDKKYNVNFCSNNGIHLITKIIFKFSNTNFNTVVLDINYILSESEFIYFLEINNNLLENMFTENFIKFFSNIDCLRFMNFDCYLEYLKIN